MIEIQTLPLCHTPFFTSYIQPIISLVIDTYITLHSSMSVRSDSIFKSDIFKGKVVFATGANSGGICSVQVEALMRHGCDAAIFGRRAELSISAAKEFENKTGKKCLGLSGDVRKPETLEKAVKDTIERFGRIDFVIAGAAGNFLSPVSLYVGLPLDFLLALLD